MKCIIKNCVYLVVMIGMSFGKSFGMHREGEGQGNFNYKQLVGQYNPQPGGYGMQYMGQYPLTYNNMPLLPATPEEDAWNQFGRECDDRGQQLQQEVRNLSNQCDQDSARLTQASLREKSYPTLNSDEMNNLFGTPGQQIQQDLFNLHKQEQTDANIAKELQEEENRKTLGQLRQETKFKQASQQQVEDAFKKAEKLQQKLQGQQQNVAQQVQQQSQTLEKQKNQSFQRTSGSGTFKDLSDGTYAYGNYRLQSFFEKILQPFNRSAESTNLTLLLIGNTYEELYVEDNISSTIFRIELFNRYKKGKKINNVSSTHKGFSIGNYEDVYVNPDKDEYSTNKVWSIDRNMLAALITTGIALKYGTVNALLAAGGIVAPNIFIVPCLLAGSMFFPMFIAIGGSIFAIGLGVAGIAAGAAVTVTALAPVALPFVLLAALLRL